jgi:hypothetical protein
MRNIILHIGAFLLPLVYTIYIEEVTIIWRVQMNAVRLPQGNPNTKDRITPKLFALIDWGLLSRGCVARLPSLIYILKALGNNTSMLFFFLSLTNN